MVATPPTRSRSMGVILATKLNVPSRCRNVVPREALIRAAAATDERRLTLVAAPAGSGKTTLLCEWHAAPFEPRPFAWLSLDEEDNDPVRFWDHVVAALDSVAPGIGGGAQAALHAPGTSLTNAVLPLLINEVAQAAPHTVLVLDDYHVIASEEVHASVGYLLDFLPANLHVAVASRTDPPLPIGRLRARGQLTEIRTRELRFDRHEAAALFTGLGLALAPELVERLLSRTEGWAAGLQLAGLSLRGHDEPEWLVAALAGQDRQITDYLGFEVLDALPAELLAFLLRTSILDRLHPSLCDALSGGSDAAARLGEAERRNLFLVRLDLSRGWLRYHQLFRELLRHRLELQSPQAVPELHRRAASWYVENGFPAEAIGHAISGGDIGRAVDLVGAHWGEFFNRGRLATVARWLEAFPSDVVRADSRLWLAKAWTAMDGGRLEEVRPWLELPARSPQPDDTSVGERGAWAELLRGLHRFKVGELQEAVQAARRTSELAHDRSPFWRTVAGCLLGITLWWSGKPHEAQGPLREALSLARQDDNNLAAVYALGYLALIEVDRGHDAQAAAHLAQVDGLIAAEPQLDEHFTSMIAHVARGRLHHGSPDRDGADAELRRSAELAARGAGILEQGYALLSLAHLDQELEESDAQELIEQARRMLAGCPDAGILEGSLRSGPTEPAAGEPGGAGEQLSARELGVLRMLRSELSLREISAELYVSLNTTKTHVKRIYLKLGVSSREQAVSRARELGLI